MHDDPGTAPVAVINPTVRPVVTFHIHADGTCTPIYNVAEMLRAEEFYRWLDAD